MSGPDSGRLVWTKDPLLCQFKERTHKCSFYLTTGPVRRGPPGVTISGYIRVKDDGIGATLSWCSQFHSASSGTAVATCQSCHVVTIFHIHRDKPLNNGNDTYRNQYCQYRLHNKKSNEHWAEGSKLFEAEAAQRILD